MSLSLNGLLSEAAPHTIRPPSFDAPRRMSRSLLRRLDDAFCAFRTGHSRRDLDRVCRRRLELLGSRLVKRHERSAEKVVFARELFGELAKSALDLLENFRQSRGRTGAADLLKTLEIERSRLRSSRMGMWAQVCSFDGADEYTIEHLKAVPVFSDERYGKLFEGLREQLVLDPFENKARFGVGHGRRLLLGLKVRWLFCVHGKIPVGALHQGYFHFEPCFGLAGEYRPAEERGHE